jgi:hypothetical protein
MGNYRKPSEYIQYLPFILWIPDWLNSGNEVAKIGGRVIQQFGSEFPPNPIAEPRQMHHHVIVGFHYPFRLWAECLLPLECGIQLKMWAFLIIGSQSNNSDSSSDRKGLKIA